MSSTLDAVVDWLASLPDWQATVALVGGAIIAALFVELVVVKVIRRVVRSSGSELDDIVFQELRWPVVVTVALIGVSASTFLPLQGRSVFLGQAELDQFVGRPSLTILILLWVRALNRIVNRFVSEVKSTTQRFEFAPVFSNVFTLVSVVAALFLVLSVWRIEITPLLGAAGIAGIAIGFAAKDTVANFFGGMALYFDDTYKMGDYIELDSGEAGTVVKIGVRSTTLLTRDEVMVTVPNSVLNAAKVINQSAPARRKRIRVPIGVAYGTDIDEFEEIVLDVAAEENRVIENPKPRMRFRRFGDSALEYELLCWVRAPSDENRAKHRLNRAIYTRLNEAGIEIPYPKRDLTVTQSPGATVPSDGSPPPASSSGSPPPAVGNGPASDPSGGSNEGLTGDQSGGSNEGLTSDQSGESDDGVDDESAGTSTADDEGTDAPPTDGSRD